LKRYLQVTKVYDKLHYSTQGRWGTETACQVGLSGVINLDKWRGAGMPNREVRKPILYS